jgi:hypothetical protein
MAFWLLNSPSASRLGIVREESLVDSGVELLPVKGLHNDGMGSKATGDFQAIGPLKIFSATRNRHDARLGLGFAEGSDELKTVTVRHHDIRDEEVERVRVQQAYRRVRAVNQHDRVAMALQPVTKKVSNPFFVVRDQNGESYNCGIRHEWKSG